MAIAEQAKSGVLPLFAVQIRRIGVAEVSMSCPVFGEPGTAISPELDLSTGVGPYDFSERTIHVFVTAASPKLPNQEASDAAAFRITVVGEFYIEDESKLQFPLEKLPVWAGRNGAAVLMPFLRERVYSLTRATGFAPVIIPLVEVLPFKVNPPSLEEQVRSQTAPGI